MISTMTTAVRPAQRLEGEVALPPDKSIAHRAALLSALSDGTSRIINYPNSADPLSTLDCLRGLGVEITSEDGILTVEGRGLDGLSAPGSPLDCGNSGTTMRLLAGILAGQAFDSTLIGDASLMGRPMTRIANPLRQMSAGIELAGTLPPIHVQGGRTLRAIEYELPVASAQVKSCVLLAGLFAEGETIVLERKPSRDHTERMLGLTTFDDGIVRRISVEGGHRIPARTWTVPADFSAAAFFLVAGLIVGEGELTLRRVGMNPSRTALLDVLRAMGGDIDVSNEQEQGGEPVADLRVRPSQLHGISIGGDIIPNLIDEIPILAVAAAVADGETEVRDAGELRVKESDRIGTLAQNLTALGAEVQEFEDGFKLQGGARLRGAHVDSFHDHRMAMAMGVAGLIAEGETHIAGADCAAISFPQFWDVLSDAAEGAVSTALS